MKVMMVVRVERRIHDNQSTICCEHGFGSAMKERAITLKETKLF